MLRNWFIIKITFDYLINDVFLEKNEKNSK